MKKFGVREVVASGIGAAICFVLLRFVAIPTPLPDTTLSIHNGVVAFMGILYGPLVGFIVGFVGNFLVDATAGWGIWWSWIIPTGVFGLIMAIGCKDFKLEDGEFTKANMVRLIVCDIIGCVVCWGILAPVGDIVFYAEPANKVFAQGALIGLSACVAVAIVAILLCKAYAASRSKKGSLTKE